MRPIRRCRWTLAGALFAGTLTPVAAIQVVGDSACGYYDVDIAAFATCVDGRVVKPDNARDVGKPDAAATPLPRLTPPSPRSRGERGGEPPRDASAPTPTAGVATVPATLVHPRANAEPQRAANQPR